MFEPRASDHNSLQQAGYGPDLRLLGDLEQVKLACLALGEQVLELRASGLIVERKKDGSKVTNADLTVSRALEETLPEIRPGIVLSEENINQINVHAISEKTDWWLIDPIDGTSSLTNGYDGFAICVALIQAGTPLLGVIAAPAQNAIYFAARGSGAFMLDIATGETIALRAESPSIDPLRLGLSYRINPTLQSQINEFLESNNLSGTIQESVSAAIKYCKVATGQLDMAGSWSPLNIWDVAAADVLVTEAGGVFCNLSSQQPIDYNPHRIKVEIPLAIGKRALRNEFLATLQARDL